MQLAMLAPAMAQLGCTTGVAFHTGGANLAQLERGGAEVHLLPQRSNHHPMQFVDIMALVRSWKPDLIQTWITQMDILGGGVAKLTGIPHILSERSSAKMYADGWKDRLRIAIGKTACAIIANSNGGADYWRNLGAAGRITVIPNAMKPLDPTEPLHPWGNRRYFVCAGRLSPEKNAQTAVRSLIAAVEAMPDMHAAIIGDGPDRGSVANLISKSTASDRLLMTGYSNDLQRWLRCATAYMSASYVEGHPNVVMEAAQARCPLILSDIPAHREAVGDGATYIAAENVNGFARALVAAGQGKGEANMRVRLAYEKTERLALKHVTQSYLNFYRQILAERP